MRYSPQKCGHIINACATLHNILIQNKLSITAEEEVLIANEIMQNRNDDLLRGMGEDHEDELNVLNNIVRDGQAVRNRMARHLFAQQN